MSELMRFPCKSSARDEGKAGHMVMYAVFFNYLKILSHHSLAKCNLLYKTHFEPLNKIRNYIYFVSIYNNSIYALRTSHLSRILKYFSYHIQFCSVLCCHLVTVLLTLIAPAQHSFYFTYLIMSTVIQLQ